MFADSFCQMLLKLREKRAVEEMHNTQNNRKEVEDEAEILKKKSKNLNK